MKRIKELFGNVVGGFVLSFALSFMLCVYAPLELYITNQSEFWFSIDIMMQPIALLFGYFFAVGFVLFCLLRSIGVLPYRIGLLIGTAALLFLYVQGNFFVSGLPALDGTDFDWSAPSPERVKSIVALLVCIALCTVIFVKFRKTLFDKITLFVSGGLSLMLLLTLTTLLLTTPAEDKAGMLGCYDIGEYEYSTDENFIILVLDAVDGYAFESAVASNSEFSDTFDDFVYYSDALAAYPYTMHSIPMILSGQWHENDMPFEDYVSECIDNSPLIKALEKKDYKMGVYGLDVLPLDAATHEGRFQNMLPYEPEYESQMSFIVLLIKMAGLKYAPWDLKEWSYDLTEYATSIKVEPEQKYDYFTWSNTKFYNDLATSSAVTKTDDKVFRFIHLEGAHVPYKYNKQMNVISGGTYRDNVEASVTLCERYLERLKECGVYDNSNIVIMSDHGYGASDNRAYVDDRMHGMLLIKGKGEQGDKMRVSDAPISYADFAEAFVRLCDGEPAAKLFSMYEGKERERRFIRYYYTKEHYMEEFTTNGKADDVKAMKPTGVVYEY